MRIAYVCEDPGISLGGTKGASVHLRSLAGALVDRGHDVVLACARTDGPNRAPACAQLLPIDDGQDVRPLEEAFSSLKVDAVLERYALAGGRALDAARDLGLPYVLEVNAPLVDEALRFRGLQEAERWRQRERLLLMRAPRVVVVSRALRAHAIASGADPRSVVVVPNGVDVDLFDGADGRAVRARFGLASSLVIGFAGSLKAWHGVRVLLEAARSLPLDTRLLIVGDGPERNALEAFAATDPNLGGRVVFAGAVPHAEMPAYLAAMDVGVAPFEPIRDFYFSPLKITEYMAAGLPVVASRQGDLPELLLDSGLLVEAGNASALQTALLTLARSPGLRRQLGEAARVRAGGMSWAHVAEQVEHALAASGSPRWSA